MSNVCALLLGSAHLLTALLFIDAGCTRRSRPLLVVMCTAQPEAVEALGAGPPKLEPGRALEAA